MTANHPEVVNAVQLAVEKARIANLEHTQEMCMEALRNGVTEAEQRRREDNPNGPRSLWQCIVWVTLSQV